MRLERLHQKLYCEPLMLSEAAFDAFDRTLQRHMAAGPLTAPAVRPVDPAGTDATFEDSIGYYRRARATGEQIRVEEVLRKYGPVAVVQVHGAIDRNLSRMEVECYNACDLQDINAALDECQDDDTIQTVLIDFDTPGGSCVGHAETAARILKLRQTKNVVATVFGQCHSLGVYLAVACEYIVIGESGWMGSVGVRCQRLDVTKALAAQGISVTHFASSDEKTDFASTKPLSPEEAARIQARVEMLYADFCDRVRAGRPGMDEEFFKAQIFYGQQAVAAGLADEVADSLDEVAVQFVTAASVYAAVPGGGGLPFNSTVTPRAQTENPFQASTALQAGPTNGGGNPNHDEKGRFTGGGPVSVSTLHQLDDNLSAKQRLVVGHAQAAIDKVHGIARDDGFLKANVRHEPKLPGAKAAYRPGAHTGEILVKGTTNEADFIEEVGHHLDHQMGGLDFASKTKHPDLTEINQAIEKSAPVKELNRMARSAKGQTNENATILRRAAKPEEKFARAYTQYIAAKSGDERIQKQVNTDRSSPYYGKQKYWSDEQFAPILKAFDNHVEKRKWK